MYSTEEAIRKLSAATGVVYSDEQLEALRKEGGMIIVACAGSGKTTLLTHMLIKRIMTGEIVDPDKVLCTTYGRAGAEEMSKRLADLAKQFGISSVMTVKTVHAICYEVLKRFGYKLDILSESETLSMIRNIIKDSDRNASRDEELANNVCSMIGYQINNLLTDAELVSSFAFSSLGISSKLYSTIRMKYVKAKVDSGRIDYDDMQLYMYQLIAKEKRKDVLDYCHWRWKQVFLDEAQDLSKIQFAILCAIMGVEGQYTKEECAIMNERLVMVGDDDQCIYSWRGASPAIMLNSGVNFNMRQIMLSTNYRCGKKIVERAANGIKNNKGRHSKKLQAFDGNCEGKIEFIHSQPDLYSTSLKANKLVKDLIDGGVSPGDIAVIARNNKHLAILNVLFMVNGVYYKGNKDSMAMSCRIMKDIKSIAYICLNPEKVRAYEGMLWKLIPSLSSKAASLLMKMGFSCGIPFHELLKYTSSKGESMFDCGMAGKMSEAEEVKVGQMYEDAIRGIPGSSVRDLARALGREDETMRFVSVLDLYRTASKFMFRSRDSVRQFNSTIKMAQEIVKLVGAQEFYNILLMVSQYESGIYSSSGPRVTVTTAHSAKGKEWRYVILLADDNISFPDFECISSMALESKRAEELREYIEGERRLHYVAMTRAKERLVVVGDILETSIFMAESLGYLEGTAEHPIMNIVLMLAMQSDLKNRYFARENWGEFVVQNGYLSETSSNKQ